MAFGASERGRGISSVMCITASYPIMLSALCRRPSIQAVPSLYPVAFAKSVKTNLASFLSPVARITMLITTTPVIDQYTNSILISNSLVDNANDTAGKLGRN